MLMHSSFLMELSSSYFSLFVVPSTPATNPAGTVTSSTSIFLEWNPPDVSDQNGVIIGYVVNVTVIATGEMFQLTTTSTNLTLDSLKPFTTYVCRIAARTVVGIGPYSIAVIATTEQAGKLLLASFPGPAQLSIACNSHVGRAWERG